MYQVLYIETCGTEYIREKMSAEKLGELMGGLDYEVIDYKKIVEEKNARV